MSPLRHVLVATDFSPSANGAFTFALMLARATDARLHLLHDVEIPTETITGATTVQERIEAARTRAREKMETLVETRRAKNVVEAYVVEQSTSPARAVPQYAARHGIDLMVLGVHGREALSERLLGSTAERVLQEAPCPVVTVRAEDEAVLRAAVTRIVVPVDFSETTDACVRYAETLAQAFEARLVLLHAGADGAEEEAIRRRLSDLAAADDAELVVASDAPEEAIVASAAEQSGTLVVMTTHRHGRLARMLTDSVAEHVIQHAPCPVLTIRADLLNGAA